MRRATVLLFVLLAMGCSTEDAVDEGTESKLTDDETLLEAKLYDEPQPSQNDTCDRHTFLSLARTGGKVVANLENRVGGACELLVEKDARAFELTSELDCGSTIWQGGQGESGGDRITISDHRQRVCHDYHAALIEIEETRRGQTYTLYGMRRPVPETR